MTTHPNRNYCYGTEKQPTNHFEKNRVTITTHLFKNYNETTKDILKLKFEAK